MNPLSLSCVAEKREMKCWSPARKHEQEKWIRIPKAIESPSNSFNDSLKGKKKQKKKNKSQKKKERKKNIYSERKPFTCSSYQPAELLLALKNSALEILSGARAHFARSRRILWNCSFPGGSEGREKKALVGTQRRKTHGSNQDKVDVKVARRSRLDKNDICVRAKCNPRAGTSMRASLCVWSLGLEKKKEGREGVGCKTMMDSLQWNFRIRYIYFFLIREINCLFDYLSACIIILDGCCRVGVWGRFYWNLVVSSMDEIGRLFG